MKVTQTMSGGPISAVSRIKSLISNLNVNPWADMYLTSWERFEKPEHITSRAQVKMRKTRIRKIGEN